MRIVQMVETMDGKVHRDRHAAKRHAESRYADAMLRLARPLVGLNYTQTAAFIDAHLAEFAALSALRADCAEDPAEDPAED